MIHTTHLLSLLCLSLMSSFIVCSEDEGGEYAQSEHSQVGSNRELSPVRSHHSNSDRDSSDQEDVVSSSPVQVTLSPARRLSLPASAIPLARALSTSTLTTTSSATTSSSLGSQAALRRLSAQENKNSATSFQQHSANHPVRSFRRQQSGSSTSSSYSTAPQSIQSTSSSSSSCQSATSQSTHAHGSPEMQKRNLGSQVAGEVTLITTQGSAPVARAEPGLWDRLWSTAQPYVQCQRSITEAAIADNTFCEKYPTAPSRFTALSQTFTEYTLQAEQKFKKDYFIRVKTAFIFAQQNNIPVLQDQTKELLERLRKKQREYKELEKLLTAHATQAAVLSTKKKSHASKGKQSKLSGDESE